MEVGVSPATVSRVLRRAGLSRLRDLEPAEPVRRYERETARRDDPHRHQEARPLRAQSAIASPAIRSRASPAAPAGSSSTSASTTHPASPSRRSCPTRNKESAVAFLKAAVAYYASLGVAIARVMTDNGSCYRSKAFAQACRDLGLKHVRTRPYTPKTNGKAERFIQTALREWAYAIAYHTSDQRAAELPVWLHRYNWHRPHGGINFKTPISRLSAGTPGTPTAVSRMLVSGGSERPTPRKVDAKSSSPTLEPIAAGLQDETAEVAEPVTARLAPVTARHPPRRGFVGGGGWLVGPL